MCGAHEWISLKNVRFAKVGSNAESGENETAKIHTLQISPSADCRTFPMAKNAGFECYEGAIMTTKELP